MTSQPNHTDWHIPDPYWEASMLATMCGVAELANVIHLETYRDGVEPEERLQLIHTRSLGRKIALALRQHHGSHHEYNAQPCLEHLVGAILTCKQLSDTNGIQPIVPGFTFAAIKAQAVGCLGYDLEDWSRDSFLFPSVMKRPQKVTASDFGTPLALYYPPLTLTTSLLRPERAYGG